jgi:hypothetical protein
MTILEKGCQGKAAWLPLHYNWPRPTPHGLGPGKPDPKACPGPFKAPRFRPANEDHWLHLQGLIHLLLGYLRRAHSLQVQQRSGSGPAIVLNCGSFVTALKLDCRMLLATN